MTLETGASSQRSSRNGQSIGYSTGTICASCSKTLSDLTNRRMLLTTEESRALEERLEVMEEELDKVDSAKRYTFLARILFGMALGLVFMFAMITIAFLIELYQQHHHMIIFLRYALIFEGIIFVMLLTIFAGMGVWCISMITTIALFIFNISDVILIGFAGFGAECEGEGFDHCSGDLFSQSRDRMMYCLCRLVLHTLVLMNLAVGNRYWSRGFNKLIKTEEGAQLYARTERYRAMYIGPTGHDFLVKEVVRDVERKKNSSSKKSRGRCPHSRSRTSTRKGSESGQSSNSGSISGIVETLTSTTVEYECCAVSRIKKGMPSVPVNKEENPNPDVPKGPPVDTPAQSANRQSVTKKDGDLQRHPNPGSSIPFNRVVKMPALESPVAYLLKKQ